ncbi:hypothetical protein Bca4012_003214 [Brassica carinata]|uniref:Sorting nexin/Vps5-like C-terminal domain-containing protein n=1 Tax=Brassica carinata TaxID=52824 RepID=A0A8X7S0U6_BRACI|nr:hypothetical protein Bca52824_042043 [Brassica carinata]
MAVLLYQPQQLHYDSATMIMRLKAIIQSLEGQMSSVTEKSAKYAQIAAEEVPKSLYCLGVRLAFRTLSYRGSYDVASKLTHNSLYHFYVFSDNIVDTSVMVNSTALNSKVSISLVLSYRFLITIMVVDSSLGIFKEFRFTAEFIEMRRAALGIFVNWIALHPELQHSEDLRTVLQADEETMERFRFQETGIFKAKPADLMQMFRVSILFSFPFSDAVLGKEKPVEETTPEYEKLKHYVFELENHLAEAQKHAYRLVKRHSELGQSLLDFGKAVKLLRACEGEPTGKAFSDIGTKSELLSIKLQKVAQQVLMNFEGPLKDYVRYVQSIKQHCELAETTKLKEINLFERMVKRMKRDSEVLNAQLYLFIRPCKTNYKRMMFFNKQRNGGKLVNLVIYKLSRFAFSVQYSFKVCWS